MNFAERYVFCFVPFFFFFLFRGEVRVVLEKKKTKYKIQRSRVDNKVSSAKWSLMDNVGENDKPDVNLLSKY